MISVVNGKIIILKEKMDKWIYSNNNTFDHVSTKYADSLVKNSPNEIEKSELYGPDGEF